MLSTQSLVPDFGICAPKSTRGVNFPATPLGQTTQVPCPSSAKGSALWTCDFVDDEIRFTPDTPDFSECRHIFIDQLDIRMQRGDDCQTVATDLYSALSRTRELFGGDFGGSLIIIEKLISVCEHQAKQRESFARVAAEYSRFCNNIEI